MVEPDVVGGVPVPRRRPVPGETGVRRRRQPAHLLGQVGAGGAQVVGTAGAGERVGLPGAGVAQVVDDRESRAAGGPGDAQPLAAGVVGVGPADHPHAPRCLLGDALGQPARGAGGRGVLRPVAMPPLMAVPSKTTTRRNTARRAAVMAAPFSGPGASADQPLLRRNERRFLAGPCAPWMFPASLPRGAPTVPAARHNRHSPRRGEANSVRNQIPQAGVSAPRYGKGERAWCMVMLPAREGAMAERANRCSAGPESAQPGGHSLGSVQADAKTRERRRRNGVPEIQGKAPITVTCLTARWAHARRRPSQSQ